MEDRLTSADDKGGTGPEPTAPAAATGAPAAPQPEFSPEPTLAEDLADRSLVELEPALGESEAGQAASKALRALARAARAFLIYDSDNDAIREFLEEVDAEMRQALQHGTLELDLRPWEMVRAGEVVYLEEDRERSLAFRLYRDGVRKVAINPEVTWDELTRLLAILSIRYTGIRQQEDDVVTLLWKAGFEHIEVEATEGFVPEDDEMSEEIADATGARNQLQAAVFGASYSFDYPWPDLHERAAVRWHELAPRELESLGHEEGSQGLPALCVRLVQETMAAMGDPHDPVDAELAVPLVREIRDFLLAEGLLAYLLETVRIIRRAPPPNGDEELRQRLLRTFTDQRALRHILDSALTAREAPAELPELIALMPGDQLAILLELFRDRWHGAGRRLGTDLMAKLASAHLSQLLELLPQTHGTMAADLLHIVSAHRPQQAVELALEMVGRDDLDLQLEAISLLEAAPYAPEIGRTLIAVLAATQEEVRCRAATILAAKGERRAFAPIARDLERRAVASLSHGEAEILGKALARLDPELALLRFREWVKPHRWYQKLHPGRASLLWAAISGLGLIPGDEPLKLIRWVEKKGGQDLQELCTGAAAEHRRLGKEHGDG